MALASRRLVICIDEPTQCGIVVSGLEIVERGLLVVPLAMDAKLFLSAPPEAMESEDPMAWINWHSKSSFRCQGVGCMAALGFLQSYSFAGSASICGNGLFTIPSSEPIQNSSLMRHPPICEREDGT